MQNPCKACGAFDVFQIGAKLDTRLLSTDATAQFNPAIKESGCKVHYPGLLKGKRIMSGKEKAKYLDCDCPLWSRGPNQPGRSLGTNDLKVALAMVQAKDAKSKDVAVHGKTLEDAIETFLKRSASRIKASP